MRHCACLSNDNIPRFVVWFMFVTMKDSMAIDCDRFITLFTYFLFCSTSVDLNAQFIMADTIVQAYVRSIQWAFGLE